MFPKKNLGEIGERLIVIADSHQNHFHNPLPSLLDFLEQEIQHQKNFVLILMGDIFDMLFGYITFSIKPHESIIQRLEKIAQQRNVYYLEGNHDFNLKPIFKHVHIIKRVHQPVLATVGGIRVSFAHGDFALGKTYELYTQIIRNPFLLYILGNIDKICNGIIFKQVQKILQKQQISYYKKDIKTFAKERISLYQGLKVEWIFEGHFHSRSTFLQQDAKNYIGLPPFYCIKDTFIVECYNDVFFIYSPMS